jgi:hypothetical protein
LFTFKNIFQSKYKQLIRIFFNMSNYPIILVDSPCTIIIALSDTELGKIALPSNMQFTNMAGEPVSSPLKSPTVADEIETLSYANTINDLMPKFIRKQEWQTEDGKTHDMLVMERLEILPIHHFDLPTRTAMIQVFETKIAELHDKGFVHGDIVRPTMFFNRNDREWMFQNIVQTPTELRLIDSGFAMIMTSKNIKPFVHLMFRERDEIEFFKEYYLENKV